MCFPLAIIYPEKYKSAGRIVRCRDANIRNQVTVVRRLTLIWRGLTEGALESINPQPTFLG